MIDFSLSPELIALQKKVEDFVREEVIPFERDARQTEHGPTEELRLELVARARKHGLVSPHASRELGGLGLDHRSKAVVFEAAGYSTLGPLAMNIHAPDEGNIHLLELIASGAQKERYLEPLVRADTRSIFCMTEPDGGAGSDPSLLKTVAQPDGDGWVVNGRKWLITGAGGNGAGFLLVMAKTLDERGKDLGASLFIAPTDHPGYRFTRQLDTIDSNAPGGHAVVVQAAKGRHAFGKTLIEHEGVGFRLADNEIELHLSRLAIWHAAWLLDSGAQARTETSMAKVFCSEACSRIVDRSLQTMGGLGVTMDTVVGRIYRDIRPFRIYDGPSEVHRFAIARRLAGKDREPRASP
jgi:acyl-CoA dehydrogenase